MAVTACIVWALLVTCVTPLTLQPYNETAAAMFLEEDKNDDGFLSSNETIGAFLKFDFNRDYRIEKNEYLCFQITDHPELGSFASAIFDEYDYNRNSLLEPSDLEHFFNSMDNNSDSLVHKSEFVDFWIQLFKKHEGYILHGHVHPASNPKACDQMNVAFNFKPYTEYATQMFASEDRNDDGQLSIAESLATFKHYDANGDGRISRIEYTCFQRGLHPGLGNFAHALYDEYDASGNDFLDDNDIRTFYGHMDLDKNSEVGRVEFVHFWVNIFKKYENYHANGAQHPANTHACSHDS